MASKHLLPLPPLLLLLLLLVLKFFCTASYLPRSASTTALFCSMRCTGAAMLLALSSANRDILQPAAT